MSFPPVRHSGKPWGPCWPAKKRRNRWVPEADPVSVDPGERFPLGSVRGVSLLPGTPAGACRGGEGGGRRVHPVDHGLRRSGMGRGHGGGFRRHVRGHGRIARFQERYSGDESQREKEKGNRANGLAWHREGTSRASELNAGKDVPWDGLSYGGGGSTRTPHEGVTNLIIPAGPQANNVRKLTKGGGEFPHPSERKGRTGACRRDPSCCVSQGAGGSRRLRCPA